MRQNHYYYYYDQQKKICSNSVRESPFREMIFAKSNQDIILRSRAIGRDSTTSTIGDLEKEATTYFAAIFLNGIFGSECFMRDYSTMATDGGAGSKLWQGWSVIWTKWYSWIAKRNYRVTKYETSMKPQTKLDQRRNWGINLDLRTRWPETEKIRFDAPTQLYWKEGMPTLRMFFFSFRIFFKGSLFTFFYFFKSTKTKIWLFLLETAVHPLI